jgi:putative membrane protein
VWTALRRWLDPGSDPDGSTPDYRFSLANERTFLAWIRTGLALIAGGLAVAQVLPASRLRLGLAVTLLGLGAGVAVHAINNWSRYERAMRQGRPLPRSAARLTLSVVIALGALALVAAVITGALGR